MTVLFRLRDYFDDISAVLAQERRATSVFANSTDVGAAREDLLVEFLAGHLPKRCEVIKGGFIFDSHGNESKQLDVIVTNDLTLQFRQFDTRDRRGKSFNCVEGCYAAISVKTTLDRPGLTDALANLASIPPMPPPQLSPLAGAQKRFFELPYKVVFAFDGTSPDVLGRHLADFLEANASVPQERRADLIIVNRQYMFTKVGPDGATTRDGQQIPPFAYYPSTFKYIGAFSLVYLLTKIQNASNFGSYLAFDFSQYADLLPCE